MGQSPLREREVHTLRAQQFQPVSGQRRVGPIAKFTDLHVWRVGRACYTCPLTVVSHDPKLTAAQVWRWLSIHEEIAHATIELHACDGC